MEELLCKASSAEIPNESMNLSVEKKDFLNVKAVLSAEKISPVEDENLEKVSTEMEEKEVNHEINGMVRNDSGVLINGASTEAPEFLAQKKFSPTLFESALNVMKNLFSPDKTKNKPASILGPISQPLNSGSPTNSICMPGNTELFSSEPETEIHFKVQSSSGENVFKNQSQNDDLEIIQSPFNLEPLNNTDESFLTTVSLIDESFHSAVTHFDEHGDILKSGVILMENILNNSQNLGLMDPYNDTLENNESLENTTLKLGNLTFEDNKVNDVLMQSKDENVEALNNFQGSTKIPNLNCSEKVQYEELKENLYSSSLQNGEESNGDVGVLMMSNFKKESSQEVDHQESLNGADLPIDSQEIKSNCEVLEASNLFLNKSFEKQMSECEIGLSREERDFCIENSISTTTVVLKTVDSVVVDNMLMSLKADDSETNTSSVTSFDSDDVNSSLENVHGKLPPKELDSAPFKQFSESDSCASESFFSLMEEKKTCISEMNLTNDKTDCIKIKLDKSDELIRQKVSNECPERQNEKDFSVDIFSMKNNEATENSEQSHVHASVQTQAFKEHNQSEIDKSQEDLPLNKPDAVPITSQQSYTILTIHDDNLNRPVIEPLNINNCHSEKKTFQLNQSGATPSVESENIEKHSADNCPNASFGIEELAKSQLKQSTPLWEKQNESSQKFFRPNSLKLNSSDSKEFSRTCESLHDKNEIEKKSNYSKSDLLVQTKEIFHHEGQVEFSPVNPINDIELLSNSAENGGGENSYDLDSIKILQSKGPNEPNQGCIQRLELNESKKSPDNLVCTSNRNLDNTLASPEPKSMKQAVCKSPNSPTAPDVNRTFEKKSKSSSANSKNQFSDTAKHNKLNSTFDKLPVSPKKNSNRKSGTPEVEKANQTFTKKRGSPEINTLSRTFDRSESPKPDKLNKTYEKFPGNDELNRTFDKKTDSRGPQILNQTFDKKSGSPLLSEKTQIVDKTSPNGNQNNRTFCKKADFDKSCAEKKLQGVNETYESLDTGEITEIKECNVSLVSETKVENFLTQENKTFEKITSAFDVLNSFPSEDRTGLNSDFISLESLDRTNKNFALRNCGDINDSFASTKSSNTSLGCSDLSTVLLNEDDFSSNQSTDELLRKLEKMDLNESPKHAAETRFDTSSRVHSEITSIPKKSAEKQNQKIQGQLMNTIKDEKMQCDSDLVQLIQEQFSLNDIEKICNVAHELTSMKISTDILKTNAQSDMLFQENTSETKFSEAETKSNSVNTLSPKSFDFLSSIGGKPTGRDLSRESLYVKFDPLVQPSANSLIDFTKEGEQLAVIDASPIESHSTNVCEKLLTISPQKKAGDIVPPPLTPLSDKTKTAAKEDKIERLRELQNEIYFLKNLFAERERLNRAKMEDYDNQIAKLTGESCMLEDKLKESCEREKSLVKKMKEQTQSISQLHIIMEEYSKVISKLTAELEAVKKENQKETESLSLEKDSYMTHLQNTEAAFTDVHTKYEKSKKTILNLKANEAMYRNTIAEQTQKLEEFKAKAKEAQEKAFLEFQKIQEQLNETKTNHAQEAARLRALLRKTELKVEALQESLDQKLKENQQLTAICDELIEGKK